MRYTIERSYETPLLTHLTVIPHVVVAQDGLDSARGLLRMVVRHLQSDRAHALHPSCARATVVNAKGRLLDVHALQLDRALPLKKVT